MLPPRRHLSRTKNRIFETPGIVPSFTLEALAGVTSRALTLPLTRMRSMWLPAKLVVIFPDALCVTVALPTTPSRTSPSPTTNFLTLPRVHAVAFPRRPWKPYDEPDRPVAVASLAVPNLVEATRRVLTLPRVPSQGSCFQPTVPEPPRPLRLTSSP